ncbi:right-handed parallel beta-helix repeat-containing protein [Candidatus Saccharibacteria bacterium]|nr:right-handed parallel beta-helix repeat-containing protein [Candidatus Saccharibacteria bacterium]
MQHKQSSRGFASLNSRIALGVSVVVVLMGAVLLVRIFAAAAVGMVEPESATRTAGAEPRNDNQASQGSYLLFGAAGVPPSDGTGVLDIRSLGVACDGVLDDTGPLQAALSTLKPGQTVKIPEGVTCRHNDLLHITQPGVRIEGPGTLMATNEERSGMWLMAKGITLENLKLTIGATTKRWEAYEQQRLRLAADDITIRKVKIEGSAAAGMYIGGKSGNFLVEDVEVLNTRADGIHTTQGAHDGIIRRPLVSGVGDDGVAMVSYVQDVDVVRAVTIESPKILNNTNGRGISVVGGEDITYKDIHIEGSNAAAVYIAAEGQWNTHGVKRVKVLGGSISGANTNAAVDHGAVFLYSSQDQYAVEDTVLQDITITDTNPAISRQVGIVTDGAARVLRSDLTNFTINGGGQSVFTSDEVVTEYNTLNWKRDGVALPDHKGF